MKGNIFIGGNIRFTQEQGFFFFFFFLGLHLQHMEIPKLGVKSELQLLNIPESFAFNVLTTSHIHPCFPRMSSKNCHQV